jgi:selenium-binding protein 1
MQSRRSNFIVQGVLLTSVLGGCTDSSSTSDDTGTSAVDPNATDGSDARHVTRIREKLLYVAAVEKTEPGATAGPDALFTIDVEQGSRTYGQIINRLDMPNVGDELHHFGYDWDNRNLLVNGLFSERQHVINVKDNPKRPTITRVSETLAADSGYVVPHTVIALPNGNDLVTMIGAAASGGGFPGGLVEINASTGKFVRPFGPPANHDFNAVGPKYMYDVGFKAELNRMVTTTFGQPKDVAGGIDTTNPTLGLGDEVCVWDMASRRVIQRVNLGPGTGALEARWTNTFGEPVGYTNTPGTGAVWAWEDFDGNGTYTFHQVLSNLGLPADMVMSSDSKFLYIADWGGGHVYQANITDRLHPVITATVNVPYAQMMRLSQDDSRLYVTNSLLSTWDDDTDVGGPRNVTYGVFLIQADNVHGGMTLVGNPLVDFQHVQKKNGVGRMRPHQAFFDPAVVFPFGFH